MPSFASARSISSVGLPIAATINPTDLWCKLDLDGPTRTLGERFWNLLAATSPRLSERLRTSLPLKRVQYSDRYIFAPLTAKVLGAVIEYLRKRALVTPKTEVAILTSAGQSGRYPGRLYDTWPDERVQQAVLQSVVAQASAAKATVTIQPKRDLDHQREMRLEFVDGEVLTIRLDHGLGFLECPGSCRFDFAAPAQSQAQRIRSLDVDLRARNDQIAIAYVGA
jgi:hypothetical protein